MTWRNWEDSRILWPEGFEDVSFEKMTFKWSLERYDSRNALSSSQDACVSHRVKEALRIPAISGAHGAKGSNILMWAQGCPGPGLRTLEVDRDCHRLSSDFHMWRGAHTHTHMRTHTHRRAHTNKYISNDVIKISTTTNWQLQFSCFSPQSKEGRMGSPYEKQVLQANPAPEQPSFTGAWKAILSGLRRYTRVTHPLLS